MPLLNSGIWSCRSSRCVGFDLRILAQAFKSKARWTVLTALTVLAALALTACQTPPPVEPSAAVPVSAPLSSQSGKRYIVDSEASEIRLLVYRDGPMARFGHNHVMTGQVRGEFSVSDTAAASGFQIEIPVASLEVDAPAARAEEGAQFAAPVSDQARKGTRDNMLGADVLDADHFALIRIESDALLGPRWNPGVTARITLRSNTSEVKFPAAVFEQPGALTVIASFQVRQSDLGLKPFSVLGGAIRVGDSIDVRVRLVARPAAQ
jgi:polyisoprenoid-binding protein YceI